jgi:gas vesicle protein
MTIQEAENKLNSLRSLPDDIKESFSQEISDLQKQIEESKQQAKEQVDVAKEQVQNNPF